VPPSLPTGRLTRPELAIPLKRLARPSQPVGRLSRPELRKAYSGALPNHAYIHEPPRQEARLSSRDIDLAKLNEAPKLLAGPQREWYAAPMVSFAPQRTIFKGEPMTPDAGPDTAEISETERKFDEENEKRWAEATAKQIEEAKFMQGVKQQQAQWLDNLYGPNGDTPETQAEEELLARIAAVEGEDPFHYKQELERNIEQDDPIGVRMAKVENQFYDDFREDIGLQELALRNPTTGEAEIRDYLSAQREANEARDDWLRKHFAGEMGLTEEEYIQRDDMLGFVIDEIRQIERDREAKFTVDEAEQMISEKMQQYDAAMAQVKEDMRKQEIEDLRAKAEENELQAERMGEDIYNLRADLDMASGRVREAEGAAEAARDAARGEYMHNTELSRQLGVVHGTLNQTAGQLDAAHGRISESAMMMQEDLNGTQRTKQRELMQQLGVVHGALNQTVRELDATRDAARGEYMHNTELSRQLGVVHGALNQTAGQLDAAHGRISESAMMAQEDLNGAQRTKQRELMQQQRDFEQRWNMNLNRMHEDMRAQLEREYMARGTEPQQEAFRPQGQPGPSPAQLGAFPHRVERFTPEEMARYQAMLPKPLGPNISLQHAWNRHVASRRRPVKTRMKRKRARASESLTATSRRDILNSRR